MYQWRSKQRIVAQDKDAVVIEEIYPVGGPIEETPFVVTYHHFENRYSGETKEEPCNKP